MKVVKASVPKKNSPNFEDLKRGDLYTHPNQFEGGEYYIYMKVGYNTRCVVAHTSKDDTCHLGNSESEISNREIISFPNAKITLGVSVA